MEVPATVIINVENTKKWNGYHYMLIMQCNKHFLMPIYTNYIDWDIARLIWIAFYKNSENKNCFIHSLPKDIVFLVFDFVGTTLGDIKKNENAIFL